MDKKKPRPMVEILREGFPQPICRDEITKLIKNAPIGLDGKKDFSQVRAAYRRNLVYEATQDRGRAEYLKDKICQHIFNGVLLPPEFAEWSLFYFYRTTPTFAPKKKGRPMIDSSHYQDLSDCLLSIQPEGKTVVEILREAAEYFETTYETVRGWYYSSKYQEYATDNLFHILKK